MPTIAKNNDVITVIIIFAVEPERQQELVDNIVEFVEKEVKHQPGFVSSSIHKSIDGVRVMNYAQWKSHKDYEAFVNNGTICWSKAFRVPSARFSRLPSGHLSASRIGVPPCILDFSTLRATLIQAIVI